MKYSICAISDSHNKHKELNIPEVDFLFHCGDWTFNGYKHEIESFAKWLNDQPAKHVVIIPGNHELQFEKDFPESKGWLLNHCPHAHLLIDESITINEIKIHGSPVQPYFCNWAYNRAPGNEPKKYVISRGDRYKEKLVLPIKPHFDLIPNGTNILLTHCPPFGVLDQTTYADGTVRDEHLGSEDLMNRVKEIKPDLHFFGHIHHPGGNQRHFDGTSFYNASVCDETYQVTNPITIVEYERE